MSDLIRRQAVLDELEKWDWQELYLPIHFKQILDDVPSVENKGEWKKTYLYHVAMGERPSILYCSVCCQCIAYPTNYCPNCGADMRGKANEV